MRKTCVYICICVMQITKLFIPHFLDPSTRFPVCLPLPLRILLFRLNRRSQRSSLTAQHRNTHRLAYISFSSVSMPPKAVLSTLFSVLDLPPTAISRFSTITARATSTSQPRFSLLSNRWRDLDHETGWQLLCTGWRRNYGYELGLGHGRRRLLGSIVFRAWW